MTELRFQTIRSPKANLRLSCAMLGFALLAAGTAAAQAPAGPTILRPGQKDQTPSGQSIRVKVNLVSVPVVVHSASGELTFDLADRDFHVFDNGVEQKLEGFEMGGTALSIAIVVETSSRIEALLPALRRTGIVFTQAVIGQSGDAAIIGYNDQVDSLLGFTSDHDAIEKTFMNLREGTSGAKLYDAMSQAVSLLRNRPETRHRIIITVAEAADTGSEEKLGEVLREAQLANITIYSVGLSSTAAKVRGPQQQTSAPSATPPGTFGLPPMPGVPQTPSTEQQRTGNVDLLALAVWAVQHATATVREHPLEIAAVATGGLYQSTLRDNSIEPAIDQIGGELQGQYTLSYRPTGADTNGYHEIKVLVDRHGVKVRARPGYYIGQPES